MKYKLKEITYQDAYGPTFVEFKKKYNKLKKDTSLFVQFSNFDLGFDNRKGYETPDHSDPIGVYAYPLWYVLSNPSDIWYGQQASFMRVLQNVAPRKTLQLQYISYSDIGNYAYKIKQKTGVRYIQDGLISKLEKDYKDASRYGQIFFQLVQRQYDTEGNFKVRSNEEQSTILKKLGFWAIEDRASRSSQAVINDREPAQICFLVPNSFNVLDTYNLRQEKHTHTSNNSRIMTVDEPSDSFIRSIAQKIFSECFNDRIAPNQKDTFYSVKVSFANNYFSIGGRRIKIEKIDTMDRSNLKLGQKPYKAYTTSNRWALKIHINSESVNTYYIAHMDRPIKDLIQEIKEDIASTPVKSDWVPLTLDNYIKQQEKEYDERMKIYRDAENEKKIKHFSSTYESWSELATTLKVDVPDLNKLDSEGKLNFVNISDSLMNLMNNKRYEIKNLDKYKNTFYPLNLMIGESYLEYLKEDPELSSMFDKFFYPILKKAEPYLSFNSYKPWEIIRKIKGDE